MFIFRAIDIERAAGPLRPVGVPSNEVLPFSEFNYDAFGNVQNEKFREVALADLLSQIIYNPAPIDGLVSQLESLFADLEAVGDRPRQLLYLNILASAYGRQGEVEKADARYRQLLAIAQDENIPSAEADALQGLIDLYEPRLSPDAQRQWWDYFYGVTAEELQPPPSQDATDPTTVADPWSVFGAEQNQFLIHLRRSWDYLESLLVAAEGRGQPRPLEGQYDSIESYYSGTEGTFILEEMQRMVEQAIADQNWPMVFSHISSVMPLYYALADYEQIITYSQTLLELATDESVQAYVATLPISMTEVEILAFYFLADAYYAQGQEQRAVEAAIQARDRYQATDYAAQVFPQQSALLSRLIPGIALLSLSGYG